MRKERGGNKKRKKDGEKMMDAAMTKQSGAAATEVNNKVLLFFFFFFADETAMGGRPTGRTERSSHVSKRTRVHILRCSTSLAATSCVASQ